MLYTIWPDPKNHGLISVSPQSDLARAPRASVLLSSGATRVPVSLAVTNRQPRDTVGLSADVLSALGLPDGLPCQLAVTHDGLRIGPVVGLLMFRYRSSMTKTALNALLNYTLLYQKTGGLLYVFSLEDLNFEAGTVSGYRYDPAAGAWAPGTFPFPDAIYRRVSIPDPLLTRLRRAVGRRMFNDIYFDKLDYWNMASALPAVAEHLPHTKQYTSFADMEHLLDSFQTVYLKPAGGMRAVGLVRVTKENGRYTFQAKLDENPTAFTAAEEAARHCETLVAGRRYLIQQAVDLLTYDDRYVDFRAIMQKDYTTEWQCTGFVTSLGKRGGVCSNYHDGARYLSFDEFTDTCLHLGKKAAFQKKQEIIDVCKRACRVLDAHGNYADLGVDVGLDKKLKPWVFELNNRCHLHAMTLFIGDYDTYYRVKTNPIQYAVRLSGFHIE